jgi:hypothetical protein
MALVSFGGVVESGIYRHYKNKNYKVIGCAKHTENGAEFVVYAAMDGDGRLWVRPKQMFMEDVEVDGKRIPRFKFLGKD